MLCSIVLCQWLIGFVVLTAQSTLQAVCSAQHKQTCPVSSQNCSSQLCLVFVIINTTGHAILWYTFYCCILDLNFYTEIITKPHVCLMLWMLMLIHSPLIPLRLYSLPYWSNPQFLIVDIWVLWHLGLSARVPECQKLWVGPVWHWTLWTTGIWTSWHWGVNVNCQTFSFLCDLSYIHFINGLLVKEMESSRWSQCWF